MTETAMMQGVLIQPEKKSVIPEKITDELKFRDRIYFITTFIYIALFIASIIWK